MMRHWTYPSAPSVGEVEIELQNLFRLERLDCEFSYSIQNSNRQKFFKKWQDYIKSQFNTQEHIKDPLKYNTKEVSWASQQTNWVWEE